MLPTGIKRTSLTMLGVASGTKVESKFQHLPVDTALTVSLAHHIVQTEFGNFSVYIQGDLESQRSSVVFLTVHDIGSNHKPLARFTSHASMDQVSARVLYVHVCLPGQDKGAGDFGADFPSMQDLSFGLVNILVHLKIPKVVGLGLGAGANILCRLAMHSPGRVLGLVAIQPTASAANVMEQLKQRIVSLKLGTMDHGPDTDQFLVYHKFGNLVEKADDKVEAIEMYKKRLHTDINPRNLKLFVESYMKRTEILDDIKAKIMCDVLIVVGSNSSFVKQTEAMLKQSDLKKTSLIKLEDVGDVLIESPKKASEAILFFCQGLGLMSSLLGPRSSSRKNSECSSGQNSRKTSLSMKSADLPNIRRLSVGTGAVGAVGAVGDVGDEQSMKSADLPNIRRLSVGTGAVGAVGDEQ
eukprot:GFUD01012323.1.p1 GENE.GFUD01012323.1~~GFUD01012323.1.p1  ORF type:complete len:411 (+),score=112.80 GFUD01012323.1:117-1349(+)